MASIDWASLREQAATEGGGSDFEPLPAGSYDVEVSQADVNTTKTNKPMIKVRYKVLNGPHKGRLIFGQFVVSSESPKAMAILFRDLDTLGAKGVLDANGSIEQVAGALLNAKANVTVEIREWNGKPSNDVKSIKAITGGGGSPLSSPFTPGAGFAPAKAPF